MSSQNLKWRSCALAASAFGLGMLTYPDNLPDSLERREPAPQEGQPRYGGTGAIGFFPAVARDPRAYL